MQRKDIPDEKILNYLRERQGEFTGLWSRRMSAGSNVLEAFPNGTSKKLVLAKMKSLLLMILVLVGCGDYQRLTTRRKSS